MIPEQLEALAEYQTSPAFNDTERLVLEYADCMAQTPAEVPEALFAALRRQFGAAQMVELTMAIAWENYRARFDHAFGVESDGFSEGSACALPVSRLAPKP